MYERFYGLRERPFSLTPDPSYLYPSRVHKEALSHLRYGIEGHAGFIVITGEIGCGKTTMLQTVLRSLDKKTSIARLMNTMLDSRELLQAIMLDFGLEPRPDTTKPYLVRELARFLVDQRNNGRLSLLVIDEAQNLSVSALEEVRMLSNLETEKSKLIHIILVGQPNLRDMLARTDLEQLRQRVTVSYHINPLTADDTHAYINHRLKYASVGAPLMFPRNVTDIIHEHSRGIARMINVIADAVLLYGYGADKRAIDVMLTREVLGELGLAEPPETSLVDNTTIGSTDPDDDPGDPDLPLRPETPTAAPAKPTPPISFAPPAALAPSTPAFQVATAVPQPVARTATAMRPVEGLRAPTVVPARIIVAPPTHYVLSDPPPRSSAGTWWARLWRSAFGDPRPAPES
jgi:putative secretion ATPase (PEP-CTERM system associated)